MTQAEKRRSPTPAVGIPDRQYYGDWDRFRQGQILDWVIQEHLARRAGRHYDVRVGDATTGELLSWALRKGLPPPGKRYLAVQQPAHDPEYAKFEGEIPSGYGAGTVRKHRQGRILITAIRPDLIAFSTSDTRFPERYILFRPPGWKPRHWVLQNVTPTRPLGFAKTHYAVIPADQVETALKQMQQGTTVSAKIDGAAAFIRLLKDGVEVLSYRTAKRTGAPIVHTERVFSGQPQMQIPPHLVGTVLRGELYGERRGKAIPPQKLNAILNASLERALQFQKAQNIRLRNAIFDVVQYGARPVDPQQVPYAQRRAWVQEALRYLPPETFTEPPTATTPEEALALWRKIRRKQHPLTREGIVLHPPTGRPTKAKLFDEYDVYVREILPGQGKYQDRGAGGFRYSLTPRGPIVGSVGSGLSDALREEMWRDPQAFIGRRARVTAMEQFPSGALRNPSLLALHEG